MQTINSMSGKSYKLNSVVREIILRKGLVPMTKSHRLYKKMISQSAEQYWCQGLVTACRGIFVRLWE